MKISLHFGRLLGDLEHHVLSCLWSRGGEGTIRDVVDAMATKRQAAYTTVMTVMNRLCDKGLLARTNQEPPHVYRTLYKEEALYRSMAGRMLDRIRSEFGDVAVACFVDEAEKASRKKLKNLLKKLRAK